MGRDIALTSMAPAVEGLLLAALELWREAADSGLAEAELFALIDHLEVVPLPRS